MKVTTGINNEWLTFDKVMKMASSTYRRSSQFNQLSTQQGAIKNTIQGCGKEFRYIWIFPPFFFLPTELGSQYSPLAMTELALLNLVGTFVLLPVSQWCYSLQPNLLSKASTGLNNVGKGCAIPRLAVFHAMSHGKNMSHKIYIMWKKPRMTQSAR